MGRQCGQILGSGKRETSLSMLRSAPVFGCFDVQKPEFTLWDHAHDLNYSETIRPYVNKSQIQPVNAGIATYWGQNTTEGSLVDTCRKGIYDYVNIAFLINYGGGQTPQLNIAGHSLNSSEIETCQGLGIKVFLSLGGAANLSSSDDAQQVASYIWNEFLGGNESDSRPLGNAVLDGVDFHIQAGKADYLADLVQALSEYNTPERKLVYLSAAPECFIPDYFLDAAIKTGHFDYVWVEFFDNPPCEYTPGNTSALFNSWDRWASYTGINTLFLGVPADPAVSPSGGYIPPQVLIDEVLPFVQNYSSYGGVMVWDHAHDLNYSETIRPYVSKSQIQYYAAI
ncbi:acidic endochitinase-like [Coffea arabica]|uniref:Acidic endochitinase-like n=1 Tax=Coffea arabica TaxID=13443 RepID=A0ABM4UAI6_COFAR